MAARQQHPAVAAGMRRALVAEREVGMPLAAVVLPLISTLAEALQFTLVEVLPFTLAAVCPHFKVVDKCSHISAINRPYTTIRPSINQTSAGTLALAVRLRSGFTPQPRIIFDRI